MLKSFVVYHLWKINRVMVGVGESLTGDSEVIIETWVTEEDGCPWERLGLIRDAA